MKEYFNGNNSDPLIGIKYLPYIKNFCSSKKIFYPCLGVFVLFVIWGSIYCVFKEKTSINKILLSRESTINSEITKTEIQNDILEAEIILLKNEARALSKKHDRKKLSKISKYLADTEVTGKGVEIILSDSVSDFLPAQSEKNIIHNTDLLKIVNILWTNSASAISVNGERIVQNTHISCIGPTILINKKRIISPFKILAIGEKLKKDELKNNAFMLSLSMRGIELNIYEKPDISVPAGKYTTYTE